MADGIGDFLAELASSAYTLAASDPAQVAEALQADGYRAKIGKNETGPVIESAAFGIDFFIQFHGCGGREKFCTGLLFISGFDLEKGASREMIEDWNEQRLVGRAFLDHVCDPFIDYYVSADPRMSVDGWSRVMNDWLLALNDFSDWVDEERENALRPVSTCRGDTAL